jgi:hypothetical protein
MQRVAVFVDAGYVFAQGSVLLTGTKQNHEFLSLNIPQVVSALRKVAVDQTNLPLPRIYWYDAIRVGRPTLEQRPSRILPTSKFALGMPGQGCATL